MYNFKKYLLIAIGYFYANCAFAEIIIPMYYTAKIGTGQFVGEVIATQTKYGVLFTPNLHNLTPTIHGFHIHVNSSCKDNGIAAGDHLDPHNTGKHLGPYGNGHLGDLPVLVINNDGTATLPVLAPRIKLVNIRDHALIIHEGSDNYSDEPQKLGGGGNRMICGVIK